MTLDHARTDAALVPGAFEERVRRRRPVIVSALLLARRKPLGAISALLIAVVALCAVFAPLIAPYDPTDTHPRE